jgi:urate oxidase
MDVQLGWNRYGKANVKFLRVVKDSPRHEVHEFIGQIMLEGPFEKAFTMSDNSSLVPTETQKNTLYALSKKYPIDPVERWTVLAAKDIMDRHKHIQSVFLHMDRLPWERVKVDGKEHNHVFQRGSSGIRFTTMTWPRSGTPKISSGFKDLQIMKTTQSGFDGYVVDEYTTLQPTSDRVMCTKVLCEWTFADGVNIDAIDFNAIYANVQKTTIELFAGDAQKGVYSASVQATIYDIGRAVLRRFASVERITFKLPNVHFYLVNFNDFKTPLLNNKEVFLTFDGAHGQIEATVERKIVSAKL